MTKKKRMIVYEKYNGRCAYCGCELEYKNMQVDHIFAKNRGGGDEIENLNPSCRSCNHYKSTLLLEDFRANLKLMPKRLMRDSVTFKNAIRYGLVQTNNHEVVFYFEMCNN